MSAGKQVGSIAPTVRWPAKPRLSTEERVAVDGWTREVEQAFRGVVSTLTNSVEEARKLAQEAKDAAGKSSTTTTVIQTAAPSPTPDEGGDPGRGTSGTPAPPPPPRQSQLVYASESAWFFSAGPL